MSEVKIPHKYKNINKVCSSDPRRPQLSGAVVDPIHKKLVAVNGATLVAVPIDVSDGEDEFVIPADGVAQIKKLNKKDKEAIVTTSPTSTLISVKTGQSEVTYKACDLNFPDWKKVLPKTPKRAINIRLDVKLLKELADALGETRVSLQIDTYPENGAEVGRDPIIVSGLEAARRSNVNDMLHSEYAVGLIMPIRDLED